MLFGLVQVREQLLAHGATESHSTGYTPVDLIGLTHIIAATSDIPCNPVAEQLEIPVVTPEWVFFSLRENRLAEVRPFTPDPRLIFLNMLATVAELPTVDKEAICSGVVAMGGRFSNNLYMYTTHIVALNLDNVSPHLPRGLLPGRRWRRRRWERGGSRGKREGGSGGGEGGKEETGLTAGE